MGLPLLTSENSGSTSSARDHSQPSYLGFPSVFSVWERQLQTQLAPLFEHVSEPMRTTLLSPITHQASQLAKMTWPKWVSIFICCQTVLADDFFDVEAKQACRTALDTIKPHVELAAAHVGYSSYCARDGVVRLGDFARYVRDAISMFKSVRKVGKVSADMFDGWSREAVVMLGLFAFDASAFDASANETLTAQYLDFLARVHATGALHTLPGAATGTVEDTRARVLALMLQSLVADGLVHYHQTVTGPWDMTVCRNISSWFDGAQRLTELGRECGQRTRGAARALLQSQDSYVDAAAVLAWLSQQWLVVWVVLLLPPIVWRPDLLVVWKSLHAVRTPTYSAYSRQVRRQWAVVARRAQQAVSAGGSSSRPDNSPLGSPESDSSISRVESSHSGSYRRPAASTAGTTSGNTPTSNSAEQKPSSSFGTGSIFLSYCRHLVAACWWPRVRFVVSAYSQLLVSVLLLPVRLLRGQ